MKLSKLILTFLILNFSFAALAEKPTLEEALQALTGVYHGLLDTDPNSKWAGREIELTVNSTGIILLTADGANAVSKVQIPSSNISVADSSGGNFRNIDLSTNVNILGTQVFIRFEPLMGISPELYLVKDGRQTQITLVNRISVGSEDIFPDLVGLAQMFGETRRVLRLPEGIPSALNTQIIGLKYSGSPTPFGIDTSLPAINICAKLY